MDNILIQVTGSKRVVLFSPQDANNLYLNGKKKVSERVSDCLMAIQLYHGENKLIFNEMMMRSTLY